MFEDQGKSEINIGAEVVLTSPTSYYGRALETVHYVGEIPEGTSLTLGEESTIFNQQTRRNRKFFHIWDSTDDKYTNFFVIADSVQHLLPKS